jgi:hypothetical protein
VKPLACVQAPLCVREGGEVIGSPKQTFVGEPRFDFGPKLHQVTSCDKTNADSERSQRPGNSVRGEKVIDTALFLSIVVKER